MNLRFYVATVIYYFLDIHLAILASTVLVHVLYNYEEFENIGVKGFCM